MKQTAVEWLINALEEWGAGRIKWPTYLWEEAESMEKEQMVRAFHAGCKQDYALEDVREWAEDYISDTYKNSKTPPGEHCKEA